MKKFALIIALVSSSVAFGGGDYKGYKGTDFYKGGDYSQLINYINTINTDLMDGEPKGFNYKKHYRKARFIHFLNRRFNRNNCKGVSHHA